MHKDVLRISAKFANMGFVCACLVVFIHIGFSPKIGTCQWWGAQMFTHVGLTRVAVPFFFLASGYFLAARMDDALWYGTAIRRRLISLGIPLLVWNVVYCAFVYGMAFVASLLKYPLHVTLPEFHSIVDVLSALGLNPLRQCALPLLWYLRCLIVFVLISPVLAYIVRKVRPSLLLPLMFLVCGLVMCRIKEGSVIYNTLNYRVSIEGLVFFMSGISFRLEPSPLRIGIRGGMISISAGIGLFLLRSICVKLGYIAVGYWMGWLGVPVLMLGMWGLMPGAKSRDCLIKSSFPIYLLHYFFGIILAGIVGVLGVREWALSKSFAFYIGRGVIVIVASLAVCIFLRKGFPRFSSFVFGGR